MMDISRLRQENEMADCITIDGTTYEGMESTIKVLRKKQDTMHPRALTSFIVWAVREGKLAVKK